MRRHIMLVGLPGAGKTTVGRIAAEKLGAGFIDSDSIIVRKMQMPVSRIFAEHGEIKFRAIEQEAMTQAMSGPPAVISPGGGWIAQPGAIHSAREKAFVVYLKVMALTASKRASGEGTRPLLVGADPVEAMRKLFQEREPFYLQADAEVKADIKTPPQLADEIVALAKERAGW